MFDALAMVLTANYSDSFICCSWTQWLKQGVIDPNSKGHYAWLFIISLAILYNITMVIARSVFTQLQTDFLAVWFVLDYACDVMYVIDTIIRFKTGRWNFLATPQH